MVINNKLSCVYLCMLVSFVVWSNDPSDAIVRIAATRSGPDLIETGTGVYISIRGHVLTAYHVIQGSNSIVVLDSFSETHNDVVVEYVDPAHDLAILRVRTARRDFPHVALANHVPGPSEDLSYFGFPNGGGLVQLMGRTTADSYVRSTSIWDQRDGQPIQIFRQEIDVIGVDGTIYPGVSGAPLISELGVVGIVAGSLNNGGGIGWAIPVKHISSWRNNSRRTLGSYNPTADQVRNWPPMSLFVEEYERSTSLGSEDTTLLGILHLIDQEVVVLEEVLFDLTSNFTNFHASYLLFQERVRLADGNTDLLLRIYAEDHMHELIGLGARIQAQMTGLSSSLLTLSRQTQTAATRIESRDAIGRELWLTMAIRLRQLESEWGDIDWPMVVPRTDAEQSTLLQLMSSRHMIDTALLELDSGSVTEAMQATLSGLESINILAEDWLAKPWWSIETVHYFEATLDTLRRGVYRPRSVEAVAITTGVAPPIETLCQRVDAIKYYLSENPDHLLGRRLPEFGERQFESTISVPGTLINTVNMNFTPPWFLAALTQTTSRNTIDLRFDEWQRSIRSCAPGARRSTNEDSPFVSSVMYSDDRFDHILSKMIARDDSSSHRILLIIRPR